MPWRELHRTSDARDALRVLTCIAAIEFDVRCVDGLGEVVDLSDAAGGGLWIIQVRAEDHPELMEVLDEIIAEQDEFDAALDQQDRRRRFVMSLAVAGSILTMLLMLFAQR